VPNRPGDPESAESGSAVQTQRSHPLRRHHRTAAADCCPADRRPRGEASPQSLAGAERGWLLVNAERWLRRYGRFGRGFPCEENRRYVVELQDPDGNRPQILEGVGPRAETA
jgi:hypothetical protein